MSQNQELERVEDLADREVFFLADQLDEMGEVVRREYAEEKEDGIEPDEEL